MCPATNLRGAPSGPRFVSTGADGWLPRDVAEAGRELGRYADFASLSEQIAEVNKNLRGWRGGWTKWDDVGMGPLLCCLVATDSL
jgi:hypothetical protein